MGPDYPLWTTPSGEKVTCVEKLKVMQQNLDELSGMAQDLFEDGILMGVDPEQLRTYLLLLINNLINPYA